MGIIGDQRGTYITALMHPPQSLQHAQKLPPKHPINLIRPQPPFPQPRQPPRQLPPPPLLKPRQHKLPPAPPKRQPIKQIKIIQHAHHAPIPLPARIPQRSGNLHRPPPDHAPRAQKPRRINRKHRPPRRHHPRAPPAQPPPELHARVKRPHQLGRQRVCPRARPVRLDHHLPPRGVERVDVQLRRHPVPLRAAAGQVPHVDVPPVVDVLGSFVDAPEIFFLGRGEEGGEVARGDGEGAGEPGVHTARAVGGRRV